jgi:hypothetical protein
VRLTFKIRGNNVTLFEERAPWQKDMVEWTSNNVAQFRYDEESIMWSLYCSDRNSKWHRYENLPPVKNLERVLEEIDSDPTGIFWG